MAAPSTLEQEILAKNTGPAERNRGWFEGREILALNLMSSPGAGKTSLLERTIRALRDEMRITWWKATRPPPTTPSASAPPARR